MKAQVWHGRKDIRYEEVPELFPAQEGWVIGKVKWAGICASDFHEYTSGPVFVPMTPHPLTGKCGSLIQGHEFSAEVVEVGKGVKRFKTGDRITSDSCIRCNDCYWCARGEFNLCEKVAFSGEMADGAFAEYIAVPEYSCYHLSSEISYETGATVEPLAVAVHAIMRSGLRIGETAGIVGCGPIGLIALQVARAAGASKVFAFEVVKSRQEMAKKLGADYVVNPENEKEMRIVEESTDGAGPDVVVECVGSERATQLAIDVARRGGRVSIIGIAHGVYNFNFNDIVFNEREVYGSCATTGAFPTALQYLSDGRVDTESLITGKILLRDLVTKGYEELLRNPMENFKILVTPDENLMTGQE